MGTPASGDQDLLLALLTYRVLVTSQLARLTGRSTAVIRRRLREYLIGDQSLVVALDGGSASDQKAYALSPRGFDMMAAQLGLDPSRVPFSRKPPSGPASPLFRHLKLSNDVSIAFTLACGADSPVELVQTLPEWEMDPDPHRRRSKKPWERFVISERLEDTESRERVHVLRPDLVVLLAPRVDPKARVACYLEADRATVSVNGVINEKILAYWHLFIRRGFWREEYKAAAMRVLFVVGATRTDQRVRSIQGALREFCRRHLERHECFRAQVRQATKAGGGTPVDLPPISSFAGCFRFARWEDLCGQDILHAPVWQDSAGERLCFFRGVSPAETPGSIDLSPEPPATLSLVQP
jgi:hypothetical protein